MFNVGKAALKGCGAVLCEGIYWTILNKLTAEITPTLPPSGVLFSVQFLLHRIYKI